MAYKVKLNQQLILASESPRRRKILSVLGFEFEVYHRKKEVDVPEFHDPEDFVITLAKRKAHEPAAHFDQGIVLTADTIVHVDGNILEKPKDAEDALRMIRMLQGTTHYVYTGICLLDCHNGMARSKYAVTGVTFAAMTNEEIEWYISTGEYHDKAGAYAVQGKASLFITGINGCFYNVVGLPVNAFYALLHEIMIPVSGTAKV